MEDTNDIKFSLQNHCRKISKSRDWNGYSGKCGIYIHQYIGSEKNLSTKDHSQNSRNL